MARLLPSHRTLVRAVSDCQSFQPHGGSLRANGPANALANALDSAHLRCETQPGASAQPLSRMVQPHGSAAWRQPAGKRPLPTPNQRHRQRAHLRCETQPGASAQPLSRMVQPHGSAAWRQPAGKRPCQRPTNALDSARTFGAKRSRGLPPNR